MGRQALSSLWVSLVVRKAGINHDTVQNGLNICKQGEGGDAGTCKLIPAEHSLGGVSSKWIYYFANFRKVLFTEWQTKLFLCKQLFRKGSLQHITAIQGLSE